ncbi:MAG: sialate O-acetylesterase [Opitutales bacterium]
MKKFLLCIYFIFIFASMQAEISMPKIFSDNMMLQRQMPVKIWGKADANALIGVEFEDQKIETRADKNGNWSMFLRPLKASFKPLVMNIYENGALAKEIKNILIGEVWIAGGQSNMQWSLNKFNLLKKDEKRGNNALIRMFTQKADATSASPQFDSPEDAKWQLCTVDNFGDFSALAFFFAEDLSASIKAPVGIVETSLGGARMVPWLAMEDIEKTPAFEKELDTFKKNYNPEFDYESALATWKEKLKEYNAKKAKAKEEGTAFKEKAPAKPTEFGRMRAQQIPSFLYNAKIAPIAGYTARSFLWYQGESDSVDAETFSEKFKSLILAWRKYWNKPMPFYFVQLPSYDIKDRQWAETRWEQLKTKNSLRMVEMAVTIDTGEEKNIHPNDKEVISKRLAKIALKRIYGNRFMTGEYEPMIRNATYDKNKALISFHLFGRKLEQKGDLRGFEILVDEEWIAPTSIRAELEKGMIVLKAQDDKVIEGVRYLWKAWAKPDVCLFSDVGLPAATFLDEKKNHKEPTPEVKATPNTPAARQGANLPAPAVRQNIQNRNAQLPANNQQAQRPMNNQEAGHSLPPAVRQNIQNRNPKLAQKALTEETKAETVEVKAEAVETKEVIVETKEELAETKERTEQSETEQTPISEKEESKE